MQARVLVLVGTIKLTMVPVSSRSRLDDVQSRQLPVDAHEWVRKIPRRAADGRTEQGGGKTGAFRPGRASGTKRGINRVKA